MTDRQNTLRRRKEQLYLNYSTRYSGLLGNESDGWTKTSGLQEVVTVIQRLSGGFVGQTTTSNPW